MLTSLERLSKLIAEQFIAIMVVLAAVVVIMIEMSLPPKSEQGWAKSKRVQCELIGKKHNVETRFTDRFRCVVDLEHGTIRVEDYLEVMR